MAHYVNDKCVNCKFTDCVVVCPVDCFHEGKNMLAINAKICIDCGLCIDECPVNAIEHYTGMQNDARTLKWLEFNYRMVEEKKWPQIIEKKAAMSNAEEMSKIEDKSLMVEE